MGHRKFDSVRYPQPQHGKHHVVIPEGKMSIVAKYRLNLTSIISIQGEMEGEWVELEGSTLSRYRLMNAALKKYLMRMNELHVQLYFQRPMHYRSKLSKNPQFIDYVFRLKTHYFFYRMYDFREWVYQTVVLLQSIRNHNHAHVII